MIPVVNSAQTKLFETFVFCSSVLMNYKCYKNRKAVSSESISWNNQFCYMDI